MLPRRPIGTSGKVEAVGAANTICVSVLDPHWFSAVATKVALGAPSGADAEN